MKKTQLFIITLLLLLVSVMPAGANRNKFNAFLSQLREEGLIPEKKEKTIFLGEFQDSYQNMGSYKWFPIAQAKNFVFSAHVDWLSASQTPNSMVSGCGLIFGADQGSDDHLLVSMRMDGNLYVTGVNKNTSLSYLKKYITNPSITGSEDISIILNGELLTIYLNGVKIAQKDNVAAMGPSLGFATLSGTNTGFGTRCSWDEIYLYTWK